MMKWVRRILKMMTECGVTGFTQRSQGLPDKITDNLTSPHDELTTATHQ